MLETGLYRILRWIVFVRNSWIFDPIIYCVNLAACRPVNVMLEMARHFLWPPFFGLSKLINLPPTSIKRTLLTSPGDAPYGILSLIGKYEKDPYSIKRRYRCSFVRSFHSNPNPKYLVRSSILSTELAQESAGKQRLHSGNQQELQVEMRVSRFL